ncbi:glycine cleavage system protein GcvH [Candidatus Fermentibacterales bacterium]|nr:glycine cleavage system protein GcvH [Candidatus Fermentibacterales bacterium]
MEGEEVATVPADLRFTETHEWARLAKGELTMGITDYAQEEMGEIVMVELPEAEARVRKGEAIGSIEAVKTAEDFYSPVDGKVLRVNEKLQSSPELVNQSPYEQGWLVVIVPEDEKSFEQLLTPEQYKQHLGE